MLGTTIALLKWLKVPRIPAFQLNPDDITVFVVGPSGSGKSLFVEDVTRSNLIRVGTSLRPCTTSVQAIRCELTDEAKEALGGPIQKNIVFIDTPSFRTGQNDETAEKEMRNWLSKSRCKSTLVGIIYMHRIETDPHYEPIQPYLRSFSSSFPQDFVTLPNKLHAVLSYEGVIPEDTIRPRREALQEQLNSSAIRRRWATSLHPDLFEPEDSETAWQAVVALLSSVGPERLSAAQGSPQIAEAPLPTVTLPSRTNTRQQTQTSIETPRQSRRAADACYTIAALLSEANTAQQLQSDMGNTETVRDPLRALNQPSATMSIEDLETEDLVIAVMGPTGAGKSTLIRAASGLDTQGVGHTLNSFTGEVRAIRFLHQENGQHVVLVDTPGFDDASKSDADILEMISEWLNASYKKEKLLSGILYLHRITDNRMAGTSLKNLRVFRKLCGKDALDKVWLVTTMWDEVEPDMGEKRLAELEQEYWKTMISYGAQVARCRGDSDSSKQIIQRVLDHEATLKAALLQENMAILKKELQETEAGQALYSHLEKLLERQTALLQRINKESKASSDMGVLMELQAEYSDLRVQIEDKLHQMQELKLSRFKALLRFFSRKRD